MAIVFYLLIVFALVFTLYLKASKTVLITGVSIITVITVSLILLFYFGKIVVPSLQKPEFPSVSENTSLKSFFDDAKYKGSEREFYGYSFKVKQGDILRLNVEKEYEKDGYSYNINTLYYQIYNFENESDARAFIPKILFQYNSNFSMSSFLRNIDKCEVSDDVSLYCMEVPEWSVKEYKLDNEMTIYYIPSVICLTDIDWFLFFGLPNILGFHIENVFAIQKEGCVFVLYEDISNSRKTEMVEAIKQITESTVDKEN